MKMLFIFTLSEHAPRARALLDVLTRKVEETLMEAQSGSVWTSGLGSTGGYSWSGRGRETEPEASPLLSDI
jgi:hypothetical protein